MVADVYGQSRNIIELNVIWCTKPLRGSFPTRSNPPVTFACRTHRFFFP